MRLGHLEERKDRKEPRRNHDAPANPEHSVKKPRNKTKQAVGKRGDG
jgi:hypothetical protein